MKKERKLFEAYENMREDSGINLLKLGLTSANISRIHKNAGLKHDEELINVNDKKSEINKKIKAGHIALGANDDKWILITSVPKIGKYNYQYYLLTADDEKYINNKTELIQHLKGNYNWYLSKDPKSIESFYSRRAEKEQDEEDKEVFDLTASGLNQFDKIIKQLGEEYLNKTNKLLQELIISDNESSPDALKVTKKLNLLCKSSIQNGINIFGSAFRDFTSFIGGKSGYNSFYKNRNIFADKMKTIEGRTEIYSDIKKLFKDKIDYAKRQLKEEE